MKKVSITNLTRWLNAFLIILCAAPAYAAPIDTPYVQHFPRGNTHSVDSFKGSVTIDNYFILSRHNLPFGKYFLSPGTGGWVDTVALNIDNVLAGGDSSARALKIGSVITNAVTVGTSVTTGSAVLLNTLTGSPTDNILVLSGNIVKQITAGALFSQITGSDIPSGIPATKIANGSVDNIEFQALNGVTGNIQSQLDSIAGLSGPTPTLQEVTTAGSTTDNVVQFNNSVFAAGMGTNGNENDSIVVWKAGELIKSPPLEEALMLVRDSLNTKVSSKDSSTPGGYYPYSSNPRGYINTTDANALYVPLSRTVNGIPLSANITLSKSDIGLGNVDNTSDLTKPVSVIQQAALDSNLKKTDTVGLLSTITRLNDSLSSYQRLFNITDYGATPSYTDSTDDDRLGIQKAILAACGFSYLSFDSVSGLMRVQQFSNKYNGGTVFSPNGIFHIRGALIKNVRHLMLNGDSVTAAVNTQLAVPYFYDSDSSKLNPVSVQFLGNIEPALSMETPTRSVESDKWRNGTRWISTRNSDGSSSPALPSILSSIRGDLVLSSLAPNIMQMFVKNMWITSHYDSTAGGTQLCGIDMQWALDCWVENCRVDVSIPSKYINSKPTTNVYGIRLTNTGSGTVIGAKNSMVTGYVFGFVAGEHSLLDNIQSFLNWSGLEQLPSFHTVFWRDIAIQWCKYGVTTGYISNPFTGQVTTILGDFRNERYCNPSWNQFEYDIKDSTNILRGYVSYYTRHLGSGCSATTGVITNQGTDSLNLVRLDAFTTQWKNMTKSVTSNTTGQLMMIDVDNKNSIFAMSKGTLASQIAPSLAGVGLGSTGGVLNVNGAAFAGTGITATGIVLSSNLSTGITGGQSLNGGTGTNDDLTINSTTGTPSSSSYVLIPKGKVAIGVQTAPSVNFVVSAEDANAAIHSERYSTNASGPIIAGRKARGTFASPTGVIADDNLLVLSGMGYTSSGTFAGGSKAAVILAAAETWSSSANGTYLTLSTTPIGSSTLAERWRVTSDGNFANTASNTTTSYIELKAGTSTIAPIKLTSGTDVSSPTAGMFAFNGTRLAFSPSTTFKRVSLSNDVTPTNGQINLGNGTDYTVTTLSSSSPTAITATGGLTVTSPVTVRHVNATSGSVVVTVTPSYAGQIFSFIRDDNSVVNTVTIQMASGNIQGAATYSITNVIGTAVPFIWDGTNSFIPW